MGTVQKAFAAVKDGLFAAVPHQRLMNFREYAFLENMRRFAALSFAVALADVLSLLLYGLYYIKEGAFLNAHLLCLALKAGLMCAAMFLLPKMEENLRGGQSGLARNLDVLFPAFCGALELLLFLAGPRDFGACARLFAALFVLAGICVHERVRGTCVLAGLSLLYTCYVVPLPYAPDAFFARAGVLIPVWAVACAGALLLSHAGYSALAQRYAASAGGARDLQEQMHGRMHLYETEYVQRAVREINADCTFVYDRARARLDFSLAAVKAFELPGQVIGDNAADIAKSLPIAPDDQPGFLKILEESLRQHEAFFSAEVQMLTRGGDFAFVSIRAHLVYTEDNKLELAYGAVLSMQKLIEYTHFLNEQAMVNNVTMLPSRQKLRGDICALLERSGESGFLLIIDIINFKEINGAYSHSIGDKVLQETAQHLRGLVRETAGVYSYDVDQFVMIAHRQDKAGAGRLMETVQQHFRETQLIEGLDLRVQFAMVAVEYYSGMTNAEELFVDLDIAIQVVKYDAQRQFSFFTDADRSEFLKKYNLSIALKKAVENQLDGFKLHYQPIIDAASRRCVGAEALLRWKNRDGEFVPPMTVIPMLEEAGLMAFVEEWIIDMACSQCSEWIKRGAGEDFFVHINLSPMQISRPTLFYELKYSIERYGLSQKNVLLEITECSNVMEKQDAISVLVQLRRGGFKVAIDDFGTGYSSLSYLSALPADEVKIDRSFVKDVDKDKAKQVFLASIVSMARSMGFSVCVEGVEDAEQCQVLGEIPSDYLQGYFFGVPTAPENFFKKHIEPNIPAEVQTT